MVLVVRNDLKMGKGKIAAQVSCHFNSDIMYLFPCSVLTLLSEHTSN